MSCAMAVSRFKKAKVPFFRSCSMALWKQRLQRQDRLPRTQTKIASKKTCRWTTEEDAFVCIGVRLPGLDRRTEKIVRDISGFKVHDCLC